MRGYQIFIILLLMVLLFPINSFAQEVAKEPMIKLAGASDIALSKNWVIAPTINIPPFRLQESVRNDAKMDIVFTASVGGGVAFNYVEKDPITGDEDIKFSWSPFSVYLTGDTTENLNDVDLSFATTVGVFNNLIMFGIGYDVGDCTYTSDNGNEKELSRWHMLLGFGVTFGS